MSSRPHALRLARWVLVAAGLWSCRGSEPAGHPAAAAGKRYTVRAEVVALPAPPGRELVLRHEAIPDFTDRSGAVVGMRSMVMPFPVAAGVSTADLAPGDRVEFAFTVDWTSGKYAIERIEKLPAGTVLTFGEAQAIPPVDAQAAEPPGR